MVSRKMTLPGAFAVVAALACATGPGKPGARQEQAQAAAPLRARFLAGLAGHWTGKLEYKDYQRPDRRVTLPTLLEVAPASAPAPDREALSLRFTYDDGPGKTVRSNDSLELNEAVSALRWGSEKEAREERQLFAVQRFDAAGDRGVLTLVAEAQGRDDNQPATLRETFVLEGDRLGILKETKIGGAPFAFRHRYDFTRAAGAAADPGAPAR